MKLSDAGLKLQEKIKSQAELGRIVRSLRAKRRKIVFTNGCFDILHVGHVEYLQRARQLGDLLVVGLNSDRSVKKIKGEDRPLNKEGDRAKVLAALSSVGYVTIFGEPTPEKLIKRIKPDVLAKGGDWKIKDMVGGDFVVSIGGCVRSIPFVKGYSTTSTIKRMKK